MKPTAAAVPTASPPWATTDTATASPGGVGPSRTYPRASAQPPERPQLTVCPGSVSITTSVRGRSLVSSVSYQVRMGQRLEQRIPSARSRTATTSPSARSGRRVLPTYRAPLTADLMSSGLSDLRCHRS